jgi:methyl-accepting chemotaxis protein
MKRRLRLRLGHKIFGAILVVLCLTAAVGLVSLNVASSVGQKSEALASHLAPGLFAISDMHYLLYQHRSLLEQYVQQVDPEEQSKIETSMQLTMEALQNRIADYKKLGLSAKEQSDLQRMEGLLADYQAEVANTQAALQDTATNSRSAPLRSVRQKFLGLDQAVRSMKEEAASQTTNEAEGVVGAFRQATKVIPTITWVALALGLLAALLITISLTRPLRALADASKQVARGDLDLKPVRVRTADEIEDLAHAFNGMVEGLAGLVRQVAVTAEEISGAALNLSNQSDRAAELTRAIAAGARESADGAVLQARDIQSVIDTVGELDRAIEYVARGASDQAGSLNQIVAVVQNMSGAITEIASVAQQVLDASQNSEHLVERTSESMTETGLGMERIRGSVVEYADLIREMGLRSSEIDEILKVITDMSDQTNMLALNAAIEAARAGEHGRGFAVVAEEIRRLAERSRVSAQEIKRVVAWIKQHTEQSIQAMEVSIRDVGEGVDLMNDARSNLEQVQIAARDTVEQASSITLLTDEIMRRSQDVEGLIHNVAAVAEENTAASEQMAASSHSVTQRMDPIGGITQKAVVSAREVNEAGGQVAAVTRQTAAAAQSLAAHAKRLEELTARFRM